MRKRILNCLFDNILWYFLYLLPILGFLITIFHNPVSFSDYMLTWDILSSSPLTSAFFEIFGADGIVPLFNTNTAGFLYYAVWFVSTFIIHLAVDCLLFLPRLAHKWLSCLTQNDD